MKLQHEAVAVAPQWRDGYCYQSLSMDPEVGEIIDMLVLSLHPSSS